MSNEKWKDNSIQFPRLLSEIMATQELDMEALGESMDLTLTELEELFSRADTEFEKIKERAFFRDFEEDDGYNK